MRRLDVPTVINNAKGFTLIEIMVVVVILGILASLVAPQIIRNILVAEQTKAKTDIRVIDEAVTMYRMSHYKYPTTDQGLDALVTPPADSTIRNYPPGGYLRNLKNDPWGFPYHYRNPGIHGEYDIFSLGADGEEGGEGANTDFGNWSLDE